ncbi:hypothetical protein [Aliikangiella sp. G2MR2-5]|uniref:hypothetical protein n=1 Tax=Aliikangiella sp. G2MR2-5 TaxID=2788943 RepID=UPI0018AB057C|nr:hypothetical protein [Aliikangiella sp. G2MR2-5]
MRYWIASILTVITGLLALPVLTQATLWDSVKVEITELSEIESTDRLAFNLNSDSQISDTQNSAVQSSKKSKSDLPDLLQTVKQLKKIHFFNVEYPETAFSYQHDFSFLALSDSKEQLVNAITSLSSTFSTTDFVNSIIQFTAP